MDPGRWWVSRDLEHRLDYTEQPYECTVKTAVIPEEHLLLRPSVQC